MTSDDVIALLTKVVRDLVNVERERVDLLKQHLEQDHGLKGEADDAGDIGSKEPH